MSPEETKRLAGLLAKVPGAKGVDLKDVQKLVELLRETPEVGSIELRGLFGTGVVITRATNSHSQPLAVDHPGPLPVPPGAREARPGTALKEVKSPMVGTFYAAPEPGAEPYVRVGQRVTAGQTVCIIEAMKIMNEIESEVAGIVREVCVEDAQPVEYGQVLFGVDPHG
jgi:acetyl-CoA carboxylase biotin carboxyl carrier protein